MKLFLATLLIVFSTSLFAQKTEYVVRDTFIAGDDIYLITNNNVLKAGTKYHQPWSTIYCSYLYVGISSSPKAYTNPAFKYVKYPNKKDRKHCDYYRRLIKTIAYGAARGEPTVFTIVENIDSVTFNLRIRGENYTFKNQ